MKVIQVNRGYHLQGGIVVSTQGKKHSVTELQRRVLELFLGSPEGMVSANELFQVAEEFLFQYGEKEPMAKIEALLRCTSTALASVGIERPFTKVRGYGFVLKRPD